jgi:3-oxoacyl-[acyl-carrier-protein] synthase-1
MPEVLEQAYRGRGPDRLLPADFPFRDTHDIYSPARFIKALFGLDGPALVICTACSSSANAFGTASEWIEADLIDAAIVGGIDSLCLTTLRGFQALDLLSPTPSKPCDADRKGISIGEAGALFLLERDAGQGGIGLLGWGASSDAHHMSTPHPEGLGAQLAITRALAAATLAPGAIDYVNLHGTGTQFNDAVEDLAVYAVFGDTVPCSSTKGWTGHALGGAGALEAIISTLALRDGFMPGCILDSVDARLRARVLTDNVDRPIQRVVSNSFGFGGNNCSLVLGRLA